MNPMKTLFPLEIMSSDVGAIIGNVRESATVILPRRNCGRASEGDSLDVSNDHGPESLFNTNSQESGNLTKRGSLAKCNDVFDSIYRYEKGMVPLRKLHIYLLRSLFGLKYHVPTLNALSNMQPPVNKTMVLYLVTPYAFLSTPPTSRPPLIGPARTFPTPWQKTKIPKVVKAAVGSSLTAVLILARMEQKPYAKKP